MRERYDDTDLKVLKNVLVEIVVLTTRRPELKNFLRGKELFLRGEIDRELKLREDERKAAEAAQAGSGTDRRRSSEKRKSPDLMSEDFFF